VDVTTSVLRSVERDLRMGDKHFPGNASGSGAAALEVLQKLKLRNQPVALLLVDHRMQMTGLEFLEQAMQLFPEVNGSC